MPAEGINYGKADVFTKWIFFVFTGFVIYFILVKLYAVLHRKKYILKNKIWLIITLITFLLIFILPDSKGKPIGLLTARLILFFFIFLIIWIAIQDVPSWLKVMVFCIINYINYALIVHNYLSVSKGCRLAEEIHSVSNYIEPNSIVLPILNSDNFLYGHISNYMSFDKPMIILEDYEAYLDHFPLQWNSKTISKELYNNLMEGNAFKDWTTTVNNYPMIKYVFVLDDKNQQSNISGELFYESLQPNYTLVYSCIDGNVKLFRKNTQ
jgi:hypothetical protein